MPRSYRRSRGEGSVYQDARGLWRAALVVADPRTGEPKRRYVSGRTRAAVVQRLSTLRADVSTGALPTATTLRDYLTRWLEAEKPRIRASSWRSREQYVRVHIIPRLGSIQVAKLTPQDVERMTSAIVTAGRSPTTAAGARTILRRALGDAVRDGLALRNVAALARPPRRPSRDLVAGRDYLAIPDLRRLLEAAGDDDGIGPLVTVAAATGLRQGELLGLAWSAVDLDARKLNVRRALARSHKGNGWELAEPKTKRSARTVKLAHVAVDALRRQQRLQAARKAVAGAAWQNVDDLAFTDAIGRPLHGYKVTREYHRLGAAAGVPAIPFHGLRHTFASSLLAGGVPLAVVSDVLGHAGLAITADTYAAVAPELRQEAADAMDRALSGGAS